MLLSFEEAPAWSGRREANPRMPPGIRAPFANKINELQVFGLDLAHRLSIYWVLPGIWNMMARCRESVVETSPVVQFRHDGKDAQRCIGTCRNLASRGSGR